MELEMLCFPQLALSECQPWLERFYHDKLNQKIFKTLYEQIQLHLLKCYPRGNRARRHSYKKKKGQIIQDLTSLLFITRTEDDPENY